MKDEEDDYDKVCPRCGVLELFDHPALTQCVRCDNRDEEERRAWVKFAAGGVSKSMRPAAEADELLGEFKKRFPYPEKK